MAESSQLIAVRQLMTASLRQFTTKMFAHMNKTEFVMGKHHFAIFNALDKVVRGKCNRLIINVAPRYSKTLLCSQMLVAYGLAINPAAKFLLLSYSGSLSQDNSMAVKDIVNSELYQTVFPRTTVRRGSDTKVRWDTTQKGGVYATTTLGQVTGFGAGSVDDSEEVIAEFDSNQGQSKSKFSGAIVIDDPLKPEEALSDLVRERVNRRFETTIRSRVNSRNTPIVIIMQRLHEHDLCGYLQEVEPDAWTVLSLPCIYTDDETGEEKALWEFKHTLTELYAKRAIDPFVFETQYMQNPKPMEGLMYRPFKTYELIPETRVRIRSNYTDSADTGADWLCSICYIETEAFVYVTDILYTKKPMEYTEPALAEMLTKEQTEIAHVEGNNGGRGFARNVERLCREMGNRKTSFRTFTQSQNKQVRIFTHANEANNTILFPADWERRFPEYAADIKSYRKEGRNAHDDAPDALTGIIEKLGSQTGLTDSELLNELL